MRRLAEVGAADQASVGGKAASLGELARAGILVPPGYVVTADAFESLMAALDPSFALRGALERLPGDDLGAIARVAAGVRATVAAAALPPEVAAEVTAGYLSLASGAGAGADAEAGAGAGTGAGAGALRDAAGDLLVAVRSSATMEDSAEASFAGLQDSYLGVGGADGVLDAVRRCWASLYNDESVGYRRRIGLPEHGLAMGVVVQWMVSPRAAGVMFTCSPVTGDRSVVAIEGTWGLGSALVSGDVSPDGFTVSKVTGEITARRVGAKLRLHSFVPNGQGITDQPMPSELRGRPCLTDDQARALARVACQVEDHYGTPQDIEWALLGDGPALAGDGPALRGDGPALRGDGPAMPGGPAEDRIVLLQSRPETVWSARSRGPVATPKPRASDHVLAMFRKTS